MTAAQAIRSAHTFPGGYPNAALSIFGHRSDTLIGKPADAREKPAALPRIQACVAARIRLAAAVLK